MMMSNSMARSIKAREKWETWPSRSRSRFSPSMSLEEVWVLNQVSQSTAISLSVHPLLDRQYLMEVHELQNSALAYL